MSASFEDELCRVYDDVLPEADADQLWTAVRRCRFRSSRQAGYPGAWRVLDGEALVAAAMLSASPSALPSGSLSPSRSASTTAPVYPTGTIFDRAFDLVLDAAQGCSDLIGTQGDAWTFATMTPTLYPSGSGLSWHRDEAAYAGAFVYYAHRHWSSAWGGELLIASVPGAEPIRDLVDAGSEQVMIPSDLDDAVESAALMRTGVGRYVLPRPNRLVVISGHAVHKIVPVHAAAGDHQRATLTGFFCRPAVKSPV